VIWLHDEAGIDMPEVDYPRLTTVRTVLDYLEARGAVGV